MQIKWNYITALMIFLIAGWMVIQTFGCRTPKNQESIMDDLMHDYQSGDFSLFIRKADSIKGLTIEPDQKRIIDSLLDMSNRIRLEFPLTVDQVDSQLNVVLTQFSADDKLRWEKSNWLETMIIDGEKKYFKRTVSNLLLMLKHYGHLTYLRNPEIINEDTLKLKHVRQVLSLSSGRGEPVVPTPMQLEYSIELKAGSVGPGEMIRCWLPFPKEIPGRQELIKAGDFFPGHEIISSSEVVHRSVFMEQKADSAGSALFSERIELNTHAVWFDLNGAEILPYDTTSPVYREYTSQQPPHIVFNERINDISDEVIGHETNPYEIVRRIFYWIDGSIPWAGALEYGVIPDIPGYVLDNFRGDCGMKTLLFMTLVRYNGIPVRWQSGWMLFPDEINLHDWCEVYYEGYGWVPVDVSFGLMPSDVIREKEFYISGLDAFRLTVNSGIGGNFYPGKYHFRSEPWDFQRGELETDTRNLYFNLWKYRMKVDWL